MSATPSLAFVIQRAIRKAIQASATSLRQHLNCVQITDYALEASDERLELTCHSGELALRQCYLDRVARSSLAKRPCGYLKTMEAEILSASTLALLVTASDLKAGHMPDCIAVQILYFMFGIMSHCLASHQIQSHFNNIFEAIICCADRAYVSHATQKTITLNGSSIRRQQVAAAKPGRVFHVRKYLKVLRELEEERAESSLNRVRQTVSNIYASVSQEVDEFMVYARGFPQAFMTGFNSALSSATPQSPTLKVVKDLRTPSPGPLRTPSRSPRHVTPKPYLRANAPSPPSRIHRIAPRRRSQPLSREEYAYSYYAVCSEPHLTQCTSIQCYRFCAPAPGTNYTPPSPPPAFAPFGQNRSLVFSLAP
ncbi:hypothetical protein K438DRAFT_1931184 [Mycena galopus ATCC 62051]|nr:hypothetical protein K438DRAFT_1931184 [Mycena galopus ATCC 62051]